MGLFRTLFGPRSAKVDLKKRFDIAGPIGHGTMSKVFKATDRQLGRLVVLKVLDREQTAKLEARFRGLNKPTEGAIAVTLDHTNLVRTLDHGDSTSGEQFLVMEVIEGYPLRYHLDTRDAAWREHRGQWLGELGDALAAVHAAGYIHRDFCPRNVLVTPASQVKVIDFGLCVPNTPPFHKPGNRTGTLDYMAPELIRRRPTDERIDVYSYAVTCYELLSGRLPRPSATSPEAVATGLRTPPDDLRRHAPDVGEAIAEVVMRGLEAEPDDRWPGAAAMAAALRDAAVPS